MDVPLWKIAAVSVAVLVSAGCSAAVQGSPLPAPSRSSPAPSSAPLPVGAHRPGECLSVSDGIAVVPCDRPHKYEVMVSDALPATIPATYPPKLGTTIGPICKSTLVPYTGSPDVAASRIEAAMLWPQEPEWTAGQRWFACLVDEHGLGGTVQRTGSLRGVLTGGLGAFRQCLAGNPADPGPAQVVPCEQPHLSEAVTPVLVLGAATDPVPTADQVTARANPFCHDAVATHLGRPRTDVGTGWTYGSPEQWKSGYVTATCFAVAASPVTGSLSG